MLSDHTRRHADPVESAPAEAVAPEDVSPTSGFVPVAGLLTEPGPSLRRSADAAPIGVLRRKGNSTGMPDALKSGVEKLSGLSLDDVRVHYNSPKPAQLQALAYAQGSDIYVSPGQEAHLPHEAWHVVLQKQGRVKPTMEGAKIEDPTLEAEAEEMGAKAAGGG